MNQLHGGTASRIPTRRISRAIISGYAALGASALTGLGPTPFIVRSIGSTQYGIWTLAGSVFGYVALLDLGLGAGVTKHVAEFDARGDTQAVSETVSAAFSLYLVLVIVAAVVTAVLSASVESVFRIPHPDAYVARTVFLILGVDACVGLPLAVLASTLNAYLHYSFLYLVSLLTTVATALLTVIALNLHFGAVGLAAITLLISIAGGAANLYYLRHTLPDVQITFATPQRGRGLLTYSGVAFVITVAAQIAFSTDAIVLAAFLSVAAVAIYGVVAKLVNLLMKIVFQAVDVLFPVLSRLQSVDDLDAVRALYLQAVKAGLAIGAPFVVCLVVFGNRILAAWVGPSFEAGYGALVVLSVTVVLHTPGHVAGLLLMAVNRHRVLAVIATVDSLSNLLLSIVLVRPFGLLGVALGTAVTIGLSNSIIVPAYVCRVLDLNPWAYVRESIAPPILLALVEVALGSLLAAHVDVSGLFRLVAASAGATSLYLVAFWFVGLTERQRHTYWSTARSVVRGPVC